MSTHGVVLTGARTSAKYLQLLANRRKKHEVIDCLSHAIDCTLGAGMSLLVFKTLQKIYHIDIESLHLNLVQFDNLMRRLVGDRSADLILVEAIRRMKSTKARGQNKSKLEGPRLRP